MAYGKYRISFIQELSVMIRKAHENKVLMQDEIYQQFLEHCVVTIQKSWRGYYERRYRVQDIVQRYKVYRLLKSVIQGYKIRKIMRKCREVISIKRELNEIQSSMRSI